MKIAETIESVFRVRDSFGKLNNYKLAEPHKKLLNSGLLGDKSALSRIINKGRQGGFSTFCAVEMLMIGQLMPFTHQYYVATKEDQAKSWLKKLETIGFDSRINTDGSRLIDIDERRSSQLEKWLKHFPKEIKKRIDYSYITGLSASPGGIRGESAINILIDEWAWMVQRKNQQREVYDAVKYFIIQGGQLTLESTPYVATDLFYKTFSEADGDLMTPFYFPIIENWQEINLNKDLRKQKLKIPFWWIDINKLEEARRDDLEYFKQECLGVPADVLYRYFTPELVHSCVDSEEKYKLDRSSICKVAIDIAQKRDLTSITVGEIINGEIWERWIEDTQLPYPRQYEEVIKPILLRYNPTEVIIDNTGIGVAIADEIDADIEVPKTKRVEMASKVVVKDKTFVKKKKAEEKKIRMGEFLAVGFKNRLYNKTYHLIEHKTALQHVLNVEKIETESGAIRFTGKRGGKRDDHYQSKTLLAANLSILDGFNQLTFGGVKKPVTMINSTEGAIVSREKKKTFVGW